MDQPSSTIQAVGVASVVMTAVWAVYTWLQLGPPIDTATSAAITGAVVTVVGYFKKENVYSFLKKEGTP